MKKVLLMWLLITGMARGQGAVEALHEVNAERAKRGLRPYVMCPQLTAGALNLAQHRAKLLCAGHTVNDFSGLPVGTTAKASGCAAWHPSWGWGSCATFDNFTYAGAAYAVGRDGRRFMHLFVR